MEREGRPTIDLNPALTFSSTPFEFSTSPSWRRAALIRYTESRTETSLIHYSVNDCRYFRVETTERKSTRQPGDARQHEIGPREFALSLDRERGRTKLSRVAINFRSRRIGLVARENTRRINVGCYGHLANPTAAHDSIQNPFRDPVLPTVPPRKRILTSNFVGYSPSLRSSSLVTEKRKLRPNKRQQLAAPSGSCLIDRKRSWPSTLARI